MLEKVKQIVALVAEVKATLYEYLDTLDPKWVQKHSFNIERQMNGVINETGFLLDIVKLLVAKDFAKFEEDWG